MSLKGRKEAEQEREEQGREDKMYLCFFCFTCIALHLYFVFSEMYH